MPTIGGQTKVAWSRNVALTAGGNLRGEADQTRLTWNYRMLVAEVAGTFVPTIGTGLFHGELQLGEIWSTDEDMMALTKPAANGDIPITTFTGAFTDTQASPANKTYTVTGRLNDAEIQWKKGDFVMFQGRVHEVVSITDGITTLP